MAIRVKVAAFPCRVHHIGKRCCFFNQATQDADPALAPLYQQQRLVCAFPHLVQLKLTLIELERLGNPDVEGICETLPRG